MPIGEIFKIELFWSGDIFWMERMFAWGIMSPYSMAKLQRRRNFGSHIGLMQLKELSNQNMLIGTVSSSPNKFNFKIPQISYLEVALWRHFGGYAGFMLSNQNWTPWRSCPIPQIPFFNLKNIIATIWQIRHFCGHLGFIQIRHISLGWIFADFE